MINWSADSSEPSEMSRPVASSLLILLKPNVHTGGTATINMVNWPTNPVQLADCISVKSWATQTHAQSLVVRDGFPEERPNWPIEQFDVTSMCDTGDDTGSQGRPYRPRPLPGSRMSPPTSLQEAGLDKIKSQQERKEPVRGRLTNTSRKETTKLPDLRQTRSSRSVFGSRRAQRRAGPQKKHRTQTAMQD